MSESGLGRLEHAFKVAAGELGHVSAAWLFAREVAAELGREGVEQLRDGLGRAYPVLDAVAGLWLEGAHAPQVDAAQVAAACQGATRLLVVGVEALHLDALLPCLPAGLRVGLVRLGLGVDWERALSNWDGRVEGTDLADFQRWAGARSVLLTFAYGGAGGELFVHPSWVRVHGPDVRTQFRTILAWDVLGAPMYVYPRWLVGVPPEQFSTLVGA